MIWNQTKYNKGGINEIKTKINYCEELEETKKLKWHKTKQNKIKAISKRIKKKKNYLE